MSSDPKMPVTMAVLPIHIPGTLLNAYKHRNEGGLPSPWPHPKETDSSPTPFLTGKASSWPRKTQTPEMELLLLVPKRMTLAKAFFLSLSNRWNIPEGARENTQPLESHHPLPSPPSSSSSTHPLLTRDEVATHEGLGELFREAVLSVPQRPAILIKMLPKIWQRHRQSVFIGVLALKFVQHKGTEWRKKARSMWRRSY